MTAKNERKQNLSLIIGLSIPVVMMLFIGIAINGPRWFNTVEPAQYDFLYTTGQPNDYALYVVKDGHLVWQENKISFGASVPQRPPLHFFVHKVSENKSREISENEALDLFLSSSIRSPDGFSIVSGRRGGWFIFGYGGSYKNRYLINENYSEKLHLETQNNGYNYYWNYQFLGWLTANE